MRQNRHSTKMYVVHHNTPSDSFRIWIVWFQPKEDSDRIRISYFQNRIGSDSKNPLSDQLCWGCAAKSVLDTLIKLQKRMVRTMTFSHNKAFSTPLFHKLNLLTLNDVFKLEIAKVMHDIENNEHLPDYISKNFERVNWTHSYNTRHSNIKGNYVLPKIRTETGKKSIVYWDTKIWQDVPHDIKSKPLLLLKKTANHLISHYINRWCLQFMDVQLWCYLATFAWNLSCMWIVSIISWFCSSFGLYKYDWVRLEQCSGLCFRFCWLAQG